MAKPDHKTQRAHVAEGGSSAPQLIDPMWILKTLGILIAAALVCGYATLCYLFYQGAWQLVLHPQKNTAILQLPGITTEPVAFAVDESGNARLHGYFLASSRSDVKYAVLYLRGGDGSFAVDPGDAGNLRLLHDAGLNVLAFDYRAYGQSAIATGKSIAHPTEETMQQDAAWAFDYLTQQRGYDTSRIIVWGEGVGASLATKLDAAHCAKDGSLQLATPCSPTLAGLILDQPDVTIPQRVKADPRARIVPAGLLLRDRFELSPVASTSKTPKLLMQTTPPQQSQWSANDKETDRLFHKAGDPSMIVTFLSGQDNFAARATALRRYLDTWLPSAAPNSTPPILLR